MPSTGNSNCKMHNSTIARTLQQYKTLFILVQFKTRTSEIESQNATNNTTKSVKPTATFERSQPTMRIYEKLLDKTDAGPGETNSRLHAE